MSATLHHVDFAREDVDLAVRHGDGNWPGLDVAAPERGAALSGLQPQAARRAQRLTKPADVLKFPLLHLDDRKDWTRWLEAAGVDGAELSHGPVLNRASMAIDAAVDGQGIALARTTLAATDLINGRLVRPFAEDLRLSKTYWIICPKATAALPKIVTFRDWLLAEAAQRHAPAQEAECGTWSPEALMGGCRGSWVSPTAWPGGLVSSRRRRTTSKPCVGSARAVLAAMHVAAWKLPFIARHVVMVGLACTRTGSECPGHPANCRVRRLRIAGSSGQAWPSPRMTGWSLVPVRPESEDTSFGLTRAAPRRHGYRIRK